MKSMFSDAQAPLLRAVQRLLITALTYDSTDAVAVVVESAISEDWASATFVGERHALELRLEPAFATGGIAEDGGPSGARMSGSSGSPAPMRAGGARLMASVASFAATVGEAEFELPGHFVAEIAVVSFSPLENGAVSLTIEALTVLN